MGAAAGPVAAVSSVASIGAGLIGTSYKMTADKAKAAGENASDQAQADRLDRAAEYGKAAAAETDAQDRESLNLTLENIDAVRAAAGADPSSPTTAALKDRTTFLSDRSRATQVGNIEAQSDQDKSDAAYLRQSGGYAIQMGNIAAKADMWSGIASAAGSVAKTKFG